MRQALFTSAEMPEAIGTVLAFSYTNKISDFALNGSPVPTLGNARQADGFARWASAVDRHVGDVLEPPTIGQILARLDEWTGGHPPLSRAWVKADLQGLSELQRDLARAALIVAKASYQIDNAVLERLIKQGVSEADLVKLGAFGGLAGARRVAKWTAAVFTPYQTVKPELANQLAPAP